MQNSESTLALAIESLNAQDWSQAEALCRQVLRDEPENARAWHLRGLVHGQQDDLQQATQYLEQAVRCNSTEPTYHYNLGLAYRGLEQPDKAVECYRVAIHLNPDLFEARNNLGNTFIELGLIDDAIRTFREFVERYPEDSEAQQHTLAALTGENVPVRCHDDYVRGVFDRDFARSFDQQLDNLHYRGPDLITAALDLFNEPPTDADVLDAGCGTGLCADILRPFSVNLVGLDLSADMLQQAKHRDQYDELIEDELTRHLQSRPNSYDVVICSDTLCYFGKIDEVVLATHESLRSNGIFIFSVECQDVDATGHPQPFALKRSGRYGHDESYIRNAVTTVGFRIERLVHETLRSEFGNAVEGLVMTAVRD
jgi:predicted TPR repeat methyltransferase